MSKIAQKIRQPSFLPGSASFLLHTELPLTATGVCSSPRSRQDSLLRRPSSRRRPAVPARRYTPPAPETGYRHNKHKKVIHTKYFRDTEFCQRFRIVQAPDMPDYPEYVEFYSDSGQRPDDDI